MLSSLASILRQRSGWRACEGYPRPWIAAALLLLLLPGPPGGVLPPFERARERVPPLAPGVHAPNRPWQEADFARVEQGGFQAVKMMSYHPPETYARLQRDRPQLQFAVRLATPWNELPPVDRFVAANAPYLRSLVEAGYRPWVEIGNEPNLELHPYAEQAFGAWYSQVLAALRQEVPEARYGFPGLAPNRREREWWAANASVIEQSDWVGVHAYWQSARQMLDPRQGLEATEVHRLFPDRPILITEAGNDSYRATRNERAEEYARFVRVVARLPYVRAVYFFILSGTPEWQRFFFDDGMAIAVGEAAREPAPVVDGVRDAWGEASHLALALLQMLVAPRATAPGPPEGRGAAATPTPSPFARRPLLTDPAPDAVSGRWVALSPAGTPGAVGSSRRPAAGLRSASSYLATDLSVRLELAPPTGTVPFAIQLAEADLFTPPGSAAHDAAPAAARDGPSRTGFALLWDGVQWNLQYYREGVPAADRPLAGAPAAGDGGALQIQVAIEPRSAAAWVWRRGEAEPTVPNAVFAPPEAAALDGARPRALFLPDLPIANLTLEGATRD